MQIARHKVHVRVICISHTLQRQAPEMQYVSSASRNPNENFEMLVRVADPLKISITFISD